MGQHPVELLFRDSQPLSVCAVHHQNDELGGEKVHAKWPLQKAQQRNATQRVGISEAETLTMGSAECYANIPSWIRNSVSDKKAKGM